MNVLLGELLPDAGNVSLFGIDGLDVGTRRVPVGYCPQFSALIPGMNARDHLLLFGRLMAIPDERLTQEIDELVRGVGLSKIADRPAGTYSGGNKRKLSVALRQETVSCRGVPYLEHILVSPVLTYVSQQFARWTWYRPDG